MVFAGMETDSLERQWFGTAYRGGVGVGGARASDRGGNSGGWWAGKFDCSSVYPCLSSSERLRNEQKMENTREQVKPRSPLVVRFRLRAPTAKHRDNTAPCSSAN